MHQDHFEIIEQLEKLAALTAMKEPEIYLTKNQDKYLLLDEATNKVAYKFDTNTQTLDELKDDVHKELWKEDHKIKDFKAEDFTEQVSPKQKEKLTMAKELSNKIQEDRKSADDTNKNQRTTSTIRRK
ncbi:hypothetical protein [Ralstonia mannitolilytica]|uniref:hypothetical protein n=1 Tax=Ralstonia mannitolilytica TaxID=105219 RepID=UPI001C977959|nr:hypothetical protein [Ralstonia mannitolilytica]MBY4717579.1 hypothetical protein [Ralstonia mannitolilytica]